MKPYDTFSKKITGFLRSLNTLNTYSVSSSYLSSLQAVKERRATFVYSLNSKALHDTTNPTCKQIFGSNFFEIFKSPYNLALKLLFMIRLEWCDD